MASSLWSMSRQNCKQSTLSKIFGLKGNRCNLIARSLSSFGGNLFCFLHCPSHTSNPVSDPKSLCKCQSRKIGRGKCQWCLASNQQHRTLSQMTEMESTKLITIEGNIGAGKTVLSKQLGKALNYKVYHEPATQNPYLAKFYEDPCKYALKLQVWLFEQRFLHYVDAVKHILSTGEGVILDRSVYSDIVFANVGYADGFIDNSGYEFYLKFREQAMNYVLPPHAIIFLNASADICKKRIVGRGRSYEKNISLEYLQQLDSEYRKLIEYMRENSRCKVLSFDWEKYGGESKATTADTDSEKREKQTVLDGSRIISDALKGINPKEIWSKEALLRAQLFVSNPEGVKAALTIDNSAVWDLLNVQ